MIDDWEVVRDDCQAENGDWGIARDDIGEENDNWRVVRDDCGAENGDWGVFRDDCGAENGDWETAGGLTFPPDVKLARANLIEPDSAENFGAN